jgi:hypothetical protein
MLFLRTMSVLLILAFASSAKANKITNADYEAVSGLNWSLLMLLKEMPAESDVNKFCVKLLKNEAIEFQAQVSHLVSLVGIALHTKDDYFVIGRLKDLVEPSPNTTWMWLRRELHWLAGTCGEFPPVVTKAEALLQLLDRATELGDSIRSRLIE